MTEVFTLGPHECGDVDPRIEIPDVPSDLSTEDLALYCGLRSFFGVFGSLIAVLGVTGNVISLVILPKTGGARSAIVFLQSLGVYDTVFLVTTFFLKTLPSVSAFGHAPVLVSNVLSAVLFPLMYIAHIGAIYSTICISSERCIAVVFPLHAVRILTMKRVKTVAVAVLLWSVVYNIPRYLLLQPTLYFDPWLNRTWVRLQPSSHFYHNTDLLRAYFGYGNTVVKVVVPVLLVSVLNAILLCYLRRRRHYLFQQVRTCSSSISSTSSSYHHHHSGVGSGGGGGGGGHHLANGHYSLKGNNSSSSSNNNHNNGKGHHGGSSIRAWWHRGRSCSNNSGGGGGGGGGGGSGSHTSSSNHHHPHHVSVGGGAAVSPRSLHAVTSSGGGRRGGGSGSGGVGGGSGHGGGRSASGGSNHRVTPVVLAITGVFLMSQVFAGTQVLLHLLDIERHYKQPSNVFSQVCDVVVLLVSATNFLLYYAFGEKFRKIIRDQVRCRSRRDRNMSPCTGRRDELTLRTFLHSNGDISAEVDGTSFPALSSRPLTEVTPLKNSAVKD